MLFKNLRVGDITRILRQEKRSAPTQDNTDIPPFIMRTQSECNTKSLDGTRTLHGIHANKDQDLR